MKVLLIYTGMNVGGAQKQLISLANKLQENNSDVIIVSDDGILLDEISNLKIKHYLLPLKKKRLRNIIYCLINLYKICIHENVDLIHSHHRYSTILSRIIGKIIRIPVIHTEHNVFNSKNKVSFRGKNIVAVSNVVKENLLRNGINKDYIEVIHNGIEVRTIIKPTLTIHQKYNLNTNAICIGVIARYSEQKGIIYLIEAMKNIVKRNKNIKVFLFGEGEQRDLYLNKINEYNLASNIYLVGVIKDVFNIIGEMDFFVLPSLFEGLPMSILEIMSQKKIVIATNVGGNKEIIKDGENGYLIESQNIRELEIKILKICNSLEEIQELEKNARLTIEKDFSLESMVTKYYNYYVTILNRN